MVASALQLSKVPKKRMLLKSNWSAETCRADNVVFTAVYGYSWSFASSSLPHLDYPELQEEKRAFADFIRHIFGNPIRPDVTFEVNQPKIRQLAERVYQGEPCVEELRGALMAAGHDELAQHFDRQDHPKGCWALDLILRDEPPHLLYIVKP